MANEITVVVKEIRGRSEAELRALRETKAEALHKARFSHALGQLQNTHTLRQLKRDIARINTVLGEKTAEA